MQHLTYVLYQVDEACRYIEDGRLEQLRLALLLLDNAAELQVERRVRDYLQSENMRERIRSQVLRIPRTADERGTLGELRDWRPLTASQKRRLDRNFDQKLRFLSERHDTLDPRLAKPLSYLHRYRNEAYHRGRVRRETIRTAAVILVEVNCRLLTTVFRVAMVSSDEDYSWLDGRFGDHRRFFGDREALEPIADDLRARVLPEFQSIARTLADHLEYRVEEMLDALDFVVSNSGLTSRAEAMQVAQAIAAVDRGEADPEGNPSDYRAGWSLADVSKVQGEIGEISGIPDPLDAFSAFSTIEERIEALEREVSSLASWIDGRIQHEIDLARGK